MADTNRIENLETVVRALRAEVAALRAEVHQMATQPPGARTVEGRAPATAVFDGALEGGAARHAGATFGARAGDLDVVGRGARGQFPGGGAPPRAGTAAGEDESLGAESLTAESRAASAPGRSDGPRAAGAEPAFGPPRPRPAGPRSTTGRSGLEALVGRYGALALGALALIMALGTLLSWAIENYDLSDAARVGLGALAAAAVAGAGVWVRRRQTPGTHRFGTVLLGIALALLHVDAWGAGPVLHLVPNEVALAAAALASAALAALAYRNNEQSLFVVAMGGALLAPFVTSDGTGRTLLLLLYGWLVLGSAVYALRGRPWPAAEWLVVGGTFVYSVVGAVRDPAAGAPWYVRDAPLFFSLNVAAAAWAAGLGERGDRGRMDVLARTLLYVALVPAFVYHDQPLVAIDRVALAFAAVGLAYLSLRDARGSRRAVVDRFALPLCWLIPALVPVLAADEPPSLAGAAVALLWAGAALAPRLFDDLERVARGVDTAVAGIASALAIPIALGVRGVGAPIGLAAHAALFCFVLRRERHVAVTIPIVLALAATGTWSYLLLTERPAYGYTPFLTAASLAAAAAVAACGVLSWVLTRTELRQALGLGEQEAKLVGAVGPAAAFLWGNEELARAVSPSVANFALIAYWATVGVVAIFVGRSRSIPAARQVGLALSILAALKAVGQASDQPSIGLRIGSYLLVGVFLLAVAYWYRAAGAERDAGVEAAV